MCSWGLFLWATRIPAMIVAELDHRQWSSWVVHRSTAADGVAASHPSADARAGSAGQWFLNLSHVDHVTLAGDHDVDSVGEAWRPGRDLVEGAIRSRR